MFFGRLGAAPDSAAYAAALSVALGCNAGLMVLTCALAFGMPRGRVAVGPNIHLD